MAKSLKEKGALELQAFQLRVHRQFSLGRIGSEDFKALHDGANALLVHVYKMEEIDDMKGGDE